MSDYDIEREIENSGLSKKQGFFGQLYSNLEDKWYSLLEKLGLQNIVDSVDKIVPSFPLFLILSFILLILLIVLLYFVFFSASSVTFTFYKGDNLVTENLLVSANVNGIDSNYTVSNGSLKLDLKKGTQVRIKVLTKGYEYSQTVLIDKSEYKIVIPLSNLNLSANSLTSILIKVLKNDQTIFNQPISATIRCNQTLQTINATITSQYTYSLPQGCSSINVKINLANYEPVSQDCDTQICNVVLQRKGEIDTLQPKYGRLVVKTLDQSNNPILGTSVSITPITSVSSNVVPSKIVDSSGSADFIQVPVGSYNVFATNMSLGLSDNKVVTVEDSQTATIQFNFNRQLISPDSNITIRVSTESNSDIDSSSCESVIVIYDSDYNIIFRSSDISCNSSVTFPFTYSDDTKVVISALEPFDQVYREFEKDYSSIDRNINALLELYDFKRDARANVYVLSRDDEEPYQNVKVGIERSVNSTNVRSSYSPKTTSEDGLASFVLAKGNYNAKIIDNECLAGNVRINIDENRNYNLNELRTFDYNILVNYADAKILLLNANNSSAITYINGELLNDSVDVDSDKFQIDGIKSCNNFSISVSKDEYIPFVAGFYVKNNQDYNITYKGYNVEDFDDSNIIYLGVYDDVSLSKKTQRIEEGSRKYYLGFDLYVDSDKDYLFELNGTGVRFDKYYTVENTSEMSRNNKELEIRARDVDSEYVTRVVIEMNVDSSANLFSLKYKTNARRDSYKTINFTKGLRFYCSELLCIDVYQGGNYLGANKVPIYLDPSTPMYTLNHKFSSTSNYNGQLMVLPQANIFQKPAQSTDTASIIDNPRYSKDYDVQFNSDKNSGNVNYILGNTISSNGTYNTFNKGKIMTVDRMPQYFSMNTYSVVNPIVKNAVTGDVLSGVDINVSYNLVLGYNRVTFLSKMYTDSFDINTVGLGSSIIPTIKVTFSKQGYISSEFILRPSNNNVDLSIGQSVVDVNLLGDYPLDLQNRSVVDFNIDLNNNGTQDYNIIALRFARLSVDSYTNSFDMDMNSISNTLIESTKKGISAKLFVDMDSIKDLESFRDIIATVQLDVNNLGTGVVRNINYLVRIRVVIPGFDNSCQVVFDNIANKDIYFTIDNNTSEVDLNIGVYGCNMVFDKYDIEMSLVSQIESNYVLYDNIISNNGSNILQPLQSNSLPYGPYSNSTSSEVSSRNASDYLPGYDSIATGSGQDNTSSDNHFNSGISDTDRYVIIGNDGIYNSGIGSYRILYGYKMDFNLNNKLGTLSEDQTVVSLDPVNSVYKLKLTNPEQINDKIYLKLKLTPKYNYKDLLRDYRTNQIHIGVFPRLDKCIDVIASYSNSDDQVITKGVDNYLVLPENREGITFNVKNNCNISFTYGSHSFYSLSNNLDTVEPFAQKTLTNYINHSNSESGANALVFSPQVADNSIVSAKEYYVNVKTSTKSNKQTKWFVEDPFIGNSNANIVYKYYNNKLLSDFLFLDMLKYDAQLFPEKDLNNVYVNLYSVNPDGSIKNIDSKRYNNSRGINYEYSNNAQSPDLFLIGVLFNRDITYSEYQIDCPNGTYIADIRASNNNINIDAIGNPYIIIRDTYDPSAFIKILCAKDTVKPRSFATQVKISLTDYKRKEYIDLIPARSCLQGGVTQIDSYIPLEYAANPIYANCQKNMCSALYFTSYIANRLISNPRIESGNVYLMADNYSKDVIKEIVTMFATNLDSVSQLNVVGSDGQDIGQIEPGLYSYNINSQSLPDGTNILTLTLSFISSVSPKLGIYSMPYDGSSVNNYGISTNSSLLFAQPNPYPTSGGIVNLKYNPSIFDKMSILTLKSDLNYDYKPGCIVKTVISSRTAYSVDRYNQLKIYDVFLSKDNQIYSKKMLDINIKYDQGLVELPADRKGYIAYIVGLLDNSACNNTQSSLVLDTISTISKGIADGSVCYIKDSDTEYYYPNLVEFVR